MTSSAITLSIAVAFVRPHLKALAMAELETTSNNDQLTRMPSSAPLEKPELHLCFDNTVHSLWSRLTKEGGQRKCPSYTAISTLMNSSLLVPVEVLGASISNTYVSRADRTESKWTLP